MHEHGSTDDVSEHELREMARTNTPQHLKRPHGTGSIKETPNGRFTARAPGVDGPHLGTFDTAEEAARAIDEYQPGQSSTRPRGQSRRGSAEAQEAAQVSRGIGRYLDDVEQGIVDGKANVYLGAIGHGLPNVSSDPSEVERAISIVKEQAREGSAVTRLKRHQRVITLTNELERLRVSLASNGDTRAFFVEHAKAWAEANGVGYGAFRMMGVPVDVLTEAGITRTFEP